MAGGLASVGWRPFVREDGVLASGGWRFARRYGCGDSFANVALESINELCVAIVGM
jgi:hypothetical protein